ncbi:MAG: hypothetical protein ABGW77_01595 [Campylobacterales bacterium]
MRVSPTPFFNYFSLYIIFGSVLAFAISSLFLEPPIFNYSVGKLLHYRYIIGTILFIPIITIGILLYLSLRDRLLSFLNRKIVARYPELRNWIFALIGGG